MVGGGKRGVVLGKRCRVRVGLKGSGGGDKIESGLSWSDEEEVGVGGGRGPFGRSGLGFKGVFPFDGEVDVNVDVDASG